MDKEEGKAAPLRNSGGEKIGEIADLYKLTCSGTWGGKGSLTQNIKSAEKMGATALVLLIADDNLRSGGNTEAGVKKE